MKKSVQDEPHLRKAQKVLAEEMTRLIHGEEALKQAIKITDALFNGDIQALTAQEIKQGFKDVPSFTQSREEEIGLVDLLVNSKISPSKRQAREDIANGAVSLNGNRITDVQYVLSSDDRIEDEFTVIRRGKKKYFLIQYA